VTYIDEDAFDGCTALTSVTIPTSVTYIDKDAFYSCPALTDVYYLGDTDSWDEIPGSDCEDLTRNGVSIHCAQQS
jgi:hypothetical protein